MLDFEFRYRSPVMSVQINGVAMPLLLDLGGGSAVSLTQKELLLVKPTFIGKSNTYIFTNGEKFVSRHFVLEQVKLGSLSLTSVSGREFHRPSFSPSDLPGHIGFGILGQYQSVINYPQKTITLFDPDAPSVTVDECEGSSISKLDIQEHTVRSRVSFGGKESYLFAWDTGASHNIVDRLVYSDTELPNLIIGGESYGVTPVKQMSISGAPFDGLIGFDFFNNNVVCFDFARHIVGIKRIQPNKPLQQSLEPDVPFAVAKPTSGSSAAELNR